MQNAPAQRKLGEPMFTNQALKALIIPLIIEQILAMTIGMLDTMMVSSVGEAAVSGVSLVDTINMILIQVFAAIAIGGSIVASQYLGRNDTENARVAARQLLYSSTAIAALIAVIAMVGGKQLLSIIYGRVEADVMRNAQIYFFITAISYPFMAICNAGFAVYRIMGKSKVTMYISILMNIINFAGNAVTIFLLKWGVAGTAATTLLSRVVGAAIILYLISKPNKAIFIDKVYKIKLKLSMIKTIMRMGIPNAIENGVFHIGKLFVATLISSLGTTAIAANAVCTQTGNFANVIGNGIGAGILTVVSRCIGAGEAAQAKMYVKKLITATFAAAALMDVLLLIFNKPLISLYGLSPEGTKLAQEIILYSLLANILFWVTAFPFANVLRGAGDVRYTLNVSLFSMFAFRISSAYFFVNVLNLGLIGVYFAQFIDWFFRSVMFVSRYFSGKWKSKRVID